MKSNDNSIDVSIIIVSWNVKELLLESIKSIKQHTNYINYEIIVIDNNSSDDSVNAIKNEYPDIRLIENKQNKGFGVANNQGVKVARGKYLVFLNPDTKLLYNIIPKLINTKENSGAFLIGPEQINHRNKVGSNCGRTHPLVFLSMLIENSLLKHKPPEKRIILKGLFKMKVLIGAFWLIKKSDFINLGMFDETVFMYTEEIYICNKINKKGGIILLDRNEYYYHYHGASTKQAPTETAFHYSYTLKNYFIKSLNNIFNKTVNE